MSRKKTQHSQIYSQHTNAHVMISLCVSVTNYVWKALFLPATCSKLSDFKETISDYNNCSTQRLHPVVSLNVVYRSTKNAGNERTHFLQHAAAAIMKICYYSIKRCRKQLFL